MVYNEERKERTILVRFTPEEWDLIESARIKTGIRTRGNLIRVYLLPFLRNNLYSSNNPMEVNSL